MEENMKPAPSLLRIRKKRMIQYAVSSAVFCCAFAVYRMRTGTGGAWTEALFLTFLLMTVLACWALVRRLGLFDLTEYSWKRLIHGLTQSRHADAGDDPMPAYDEWLKTDRRPAGMGEPLVCALAFFLLYLTAEFLLTSK